MTSFSGEQLVAPGISEFLEKGEGTVFFVIRVSGEGRRPENLKQHSYHFG